MKFSYKYFFKSSSQVRPMHRGAARQNHGGKRLRPARADRAARCAASLGGRGRESDSGANRGDPRETAASFTTSYFCRAQKYSSVNKKKKIINRNEASGCAPLQEVSTRA